jgi:hypothetical protein
LFWFLFWFWLLLFWLFLQFSELLVLLLYLLLSIFFPHILPPFAAFLPEPAFILGFREA